MNIALTKELEKLIQRHVDTGMYSNSSEVVRDALRRFEENDPYSGVRNLICSRIEETEEDGYSKKILMTL